MYLSNDDGMNGVAVDENSQIQHSSTPPVIPNLLSPSCATLLVVDDNSNSNDSSLDPTTITSNPMSSVAQGTNIPEAPYSPGLTIDAANDTPEQQRRRNSSIAKLLGGQPLNNQQYEEINQQILDDQSAQSNNSDNGADSGIPRSRSSIAKTLLMNAERSNNITPTTSTPARSPSPGFAKDFEYLIRRELDIEHVPSTLKRNSTTPSVFQNLNSVRSTSSTNPQSPSQSKLKRKRPHPKQTPPTTSSTPPMTTNKSSNNAPFAIHDPFELDSSSSLVPPKNLTLAHCSHPQQNDLYRYENSYRHYHHPPPRHQQHFSLPMSSSTVNNPPLKYHKLNLNSPLYAQFNVHHDRSTSAASCSSSSPSSCNCCYYPSSLELTLPSPVSPLSIHTSSSSSSLIPHHSMPTSSRKVKSMNSRPDTYDHQMQRSYSTISDQSNISSPSSASSSSSGHSVPLKKRLLHAYKNEQCPST